MKFQKLLGNDMFIIYLISAQFSTRNTANGRSTNIWIFYSPLSKEPATELLVPYFSSVLRKWDSTLSVQRLPINLVGFMFKVFLIDSISTSRLKLEASIGKF